jgi:hypothetical protein
MNRLDYFEILRISPTASQKEITQAYRRLARRFHPDLQPPEQKRWAEAHMKQLNEAYTVLGDPEARRRYTASCGLNVGEHWASNAWSADAPLRKTVRPRSLRWRKIITLVDFVFWMLVVAFVVMGAVIMAFEGGGIFQAFGAAHGLQCVFAALWWVMLVAALFKMVPIRR